MSQLDDAKIGVIVYAFTGGSRALGADGDVAQRARLEACSRGIPLVISAQAAGAALRSVGAQRIALIHPPRFSPEDDRLGRDHLSAQGFG